MTAIGWLRSVKVTAMTFLFKAFVEFVLAWKRMKAVEAFDAPPANVGAKTYRLVGVFAAYCFSDRLFPLALGKMSAMWQIDPHQLEQPRILPRRHAAIYLRGLLHRMGYVPVSWVGRVMRSHNRTTVRPTRRLA